MLKKMNKKLLVSLGVLLAPMTAADAAENVSSYAELTAAIADETKAADIALTDNITFGTVAEGTTIPLQYATSITGATYAITSNSDAQAPIFSVGTGLSLSIANATLAQAVAGGDAALLTAAGTGTISLNSVTMNNSDTAVSLSDTSALTVGIADTAGDTVFNGGIARNGDDATVVTKTGTGNFTVNDSTVAAGTFTLSEGTVTLKNSTINADAITLADGTTLTVQGDEAVTLGSSMTTAAGDTANFSITNTDKVTIDADMSGASVVYNQTAGTVDVNDGFFAAADGSSVGANGVINFNDGSSISTDNLSVSGKITFNNNDTTAINGAKFSTDGGTITYGANTVSLSQADVVLNNGYVLPSTAADDTTEMIEIGQDTQGVKSLTLQNASIGANAKVNLTTGVLNFENSSSAVAGSTIAVDDNSVVNFKNTDTTAAITVGSAISGTGAVNKTGAGEVSMTGDSSGFTGTYTQSAGTVSFAEDSKFFTGTSNISNATLNLGTGVDVDAAATLNLNGNAVVNAEDDNTIAATVKATNAGNEINGYALTINGSANKYATVTVGDGTAVSALTLAPALSGTETGTVTLGAYTNNTVNANGTLTLDTTNGNVVVAANAVEGDASIKNNGTLAITGTNKVTLNGDVNGNGVITKAGTGSLDVNSADVNAKTITATAGALNLDKATITAETNSLVLNSLTAVNEDNKIAGHTLSINGVSAADNLVLTVGDDDETESNLTIAPLAVQTPVVDGDGNPVLDEDGNPTYTITNGTAAIGTFTQATVKSGATLNLDSTNGAITIAKNATDDTNTITNNGTLNVTGTNSVTTRGSIAGTGTLAKVGTGTLAIVADTADTTVTQGTVNVSAGTVSLTGDTDNDYTATLSATTALNVSDSALTLNGNTSVTGVKNTITNGSITALSTDNKISGHTLTVNGTAATDTEEAKYLTLTVGDGTTASELTLAPTAVVDDTETTNGTATIGAYAKVNVLKSSILDLDSEDGDITVTANENPISLAQDATLSLSGDNTITLANSVETADDATANVLISNTENPTVNLNADMSDAYVVYTQQAGTVNVNKAFFATQAGSTVGTNGKINFNDGSSISNDNLTVSGAATFNKNSTTSMAGAKLASDSGYVTFGENKVNLAQADLILNNGYILTSDAADDTTGNIEIGQTTQGVKTLTLQNAGIDSTAKLNLETGTLNIEDGATLASGSTIAADANSVINFNNESETVTIGSDISGAGTINKVDNNDPQTNLGTVKLTGDNSGFTGTYNQNVGTVEFVSGSTFFGDGFTPNVTGGELKIDDGVKFTNTIPVVIPVNNSNFETTDDNAVADLSTQQVTVGENQAVTFQLTNSGLEADKNASVVASTNTIVIGNDGTNSLIKNVSLGDTDYASGSQVTVTVSGSNALQLVNVNDDDNVGVLTIGNNTTIVSDSTNPGSITTTMGDDTEFVLNIDEGAPLDGKSLPLNLNATAAATGTAHNAKVTKLGDGELVLSGTNSNFNGTLEVDNGKVTLADSTAVLGSNVVYSIENAETGANIELAPVHDVTATSDMAITGINLANNATAKVYNTEVSDGTITVAGSTLVDNGSNLVMTAADAITLTDTKIGSTTDADATITAPTITFNNTAANPVLVNGSDSTLTLNGTTTVANDFTIKNATVNLNGDMAIGGNYSVGSTVNMINNSINTQSVAGNMTVTGNTDYQIDVNGLLLKSDNVYVNGTISAANTYTMDISKINLITEPKYENTFYQVFSDSNSRAGQEIDTNVVFTSSTGIIDGTVGKYIMASAGSGQYLLSRVGYQPYALAGGVAAQAQYYTQLNSYNMAFANADMVMALPKSERQAYLNANRYASAEDELLPVIASSDGETASDVVSDRAVFEPSKLIENSAGGWFRPYGSFEKVQLKDGPEVGNNMYGAYFGAESMVKKLGHGFDGSLGVYAGYDGSHQTYDGVGIYQNGGTLGITGSLYKGNFFNLSTANIGASGGEQKYNLGSADFWILRGGIANKTGYNWDLADGKFIIQPHLLMSISSVNLFSYEAAYNMDNGAESLFTYQLAPGVKFIGNTANGWQPYASFDVLWNIGGKTNMRVNDITIPEMHSKPWIEYGLGVQKRWGDRFTGYGQAMFRSIGRNGVAFTAGMRWRVGEGR